MQANVEAPDNLLDPVDRRFLALLEQARGFLAAQLDQRADAVVANRREVRGGARGHAAGDRAAIDDDDLLSRFGKFIGDRQAGDAGADHHRVAALPSLKARRSGPTSTCIHSDRVRSPLRS